MGFKAMRKTTTLALLLVLAVPAPAWAAARVVAPPGFSEADQYYQTLPSPTGPRAPAPAKEAREGALSEATERALAQRGPAGQGLAAAVARTAPAPAAGGAQGGGGSPSPPSATIAERGGLGDLFPIVLIVAAAAAIAFAVGKNRRGSVSR
jgi:hypothetical protein